MTTLTLHHGENQQEYVEHPIEVARRALMAAAKVESGRWPELLRRVAQSLPERGAIRKGA
jgi:hypothetical protein